VPAEEIVPGVWGISQGYVSAFVVAGDGVTLVDSGLSAKVAALKRSLAAASLDGFRDIVLTHHHVDHRGGLSVLVAESGARVWAHPADAAVVRGEVPPPDPAPRNPIERLGVRVLKRVVPTAPPARVDQEIRDGQTLPVAGGLVAHHTPGHTQGHVSYLLPSKRVLFVGDAAANMLGRLGPPLGVYTEDHAAVRTSIAKLAELDFDVACFGHGRVLKGGASARFRRLAEKVSR
jgi:glyoxylase-like metal-dependent hydrolase (beta-lactamase superfamily II)